MNKKSIKFSLGLLIALAGFPQISETIYTPALPSVASGLSASAYLVEATLAIYFFGFAAGVLLWGMISDWSGRRYAMLAGIVVYGVGTVACAATTSVEALLGWRFLQAFGASVGSVITQTMLRDAYEGTQRTKLFAVVAGALAFSPAIGPVLGGFISQYLGWRANFWALALLAVGLVIWTWLRLPETRPGQLKVMSWRHIYSLLVEMLTDRRLWGHVLLIGATNGILFGFYQEAPFVFIEQLGMSSSHYGLFGVLIAAATILAARVAYRQSGRFSAESMIRFGAACVCVGGGLLAVISMSGLLPSTAVGVALLLVLFVIFFGVGLIIPNALSQALKDYQQAAGTAGSVFGGCYYCVVAVCCCAMSAMHNGAAWPLPVYITALGVVLACGSRMVGYRYAPA